MTPDKQPSQTSGQSDSTIDAGEEFLASGSDPFPGEFRLIREVGRGAFGSVWLAEDLSPLGRRVALKFVRLHTPQARRALDAMRQEARLLAALSHPNVVQVHAWRQPVGVDLPCLVLQYVAGGSLEGIVEHGKPLPWHLAARYIADVADGLGALHRRGIIHRDVKPANMLHDPDADEALLTDLGIAARLSDPATIAGTPRYMAPEAFRGEVSPALDVYGLAASLFWLITGEHAFDGDSRGSLVRAIERGLADNDARFAVMPGALESILRAGLAASPVHRPSLEAFAELLRGALNRLLADQLGEMGWQSPLLRLVVSRLDASGRAVPIVASHATEVGLRDMRRVPALPQRVMVHTDDRVRLEVIADRPGYVIVFNVGPSGRLNLLYPDNPGELPHRVKPGRAVSLGQIKLTPPTGRERLFALWTREPLPLRLMDLTSIVQSSGQRRPEEYMATRDMVRVEESLGHVAAEDRHVVVVELDHQDRPVQDFGTVAKADNKDR